MSDYLPLALKYRPSKLDEVVGQDVFVRTLSNSIKLGRVHHGYVLVGPHGCGKTSSARVVAAALNCQKGPSVNPCGKCSNCVSIRNGKNNDVIELDAASNGQIENIRDLKTEASYSPVDSRYKIFIIDEAHAMSKAAFDALLKVLEEPPAYVKFFLATTERSKMKATILSRCQLFSFRTLPWGLIAAHLKGVCKTEGVQVDEDALRVISKKALGHMRDGLQHLDTVISYAGGEPLTGQNAREALEEVDEAMFFEVIESVIQKSFARGVKAIQDMLNGGSGVGSILSGFVNHVRTLMIIGVSETTAGLISLSDEEKKKFLHQRQLMKLDLIDDMITYLADIHRGLAYNVSPQVLFEHFLLKSIKRHYQLSKSEG